MVRKGFIILVLLTSSLFANVGKIVALKGDVSISREDKELLGEIGSIILESDEIYTKENAKIQLLFNDNTVITIGNNSHFKINQYLYNEKDKEYKADFGLVKGAFRTITGKIGKVAPSKFKLNSKTSSIGIRGTQILSRMAIDGDRVVCVEGEIIITHLRTGKTITIKAGEFVDLSVDNDNLEVQTLTQQDIDGLDENTRFLLNDNEEVKLDDLGVEITTPDTWGEWSKKQESVDTLYDDEIDLVKGVSGTTDPNYIINATHTANYMGRLSGTATDGAITENIDSLSSSIYLDVNFGTNSISGGLYITTGVQIEIDILNGGLTGVVKADGTGFTLQGPVGPAGTSGNSGTWGGIGNGTFHGATADTIKGSLNMDNGYGVSFNSTFEAKQ